MVMPVDKFIQRNGQSFRKVPDISPEDSKRILRDSAINEDEDALIALIDTKGELEAMGIDIQEYLDWV